MLGTITFFSLGALVMIESSQTATTPGPIPLAEISNRGVQGMLGRPLGTIVNVSGEVVANDSRAKEDADQPFFLRIDQVDGKKLAKPVRYPFRLANQWVKMPVPKIGQRFEYAGYETGAFQGSPDGEFKYVPAYTSVGFSFVSEFRVLGPAVQKK
jgi:hypothetical protein